jgi:RNA polymerase sigma-70 factor, ECF subfamily
MSVTMTDRPASALPVGPAAPGQDASAAAAALEASLIARAVAGDATVLGELIAAHQQRIAGLVQRLLGWPADVDDVLQDVFIDAIRNLKHFDGRSSLATWLVRIAINRCRSHQRKRWFRLGFMRRMNAAAAEVPAPGSGDSPTDATTTREAVEQVHEAIRQLNARDREIIVLRYLEEVPIEEIAQTLGLSRGAADVRLSRARGRLESILKPYMQA